MILVALLITIAGIAVSCFVTTIMTNSLQLKPQSLPAIAIPIDREAHNL